LNQSQNPEPTSRPVHALLGALTERHHFGSIPKRQTHLEQILPTTKTLAITETLCLVEPLTYQMSNKLKNNCIEEQY
jgi:hypothetical protein